MVQSDEKLVSACVAGSKGAYEALVRRYQRSVRAAALAVLGDFHRAEDAAQDTFIQAWRKLSALRKKASFGPWIMKIAKRSALDIARRGTDKVSSSSGLEQVFEKPNGKLETEKRILLAAVMKLPQSQRHLIMLRYFDRYSVNEVAQVTNRSVGTVTKQLSRARNRLKVIIEREQK